MRGEDEERRGEMRPAKISRSLRTFTPDLKSFPKLMISKVTGVSFSGESNQKKKKG